MAGKLTAAFVKSARHSGRTGRPEKHYDMHGLFLQVTPSGSKQFVQRLVVAGKRSDYGLGGYPIVSLAEAREAAWENRRAARRGEVPEVEARRRVTVARRAGEAPPVAGGPRGPTFAAAFEQVLTMRAPSWKESVRASSVRSWRQHLRDYLDGIAERPVADLTSADVQAAVTPLWATKHKTAQKLLRRIGNVMQWAITHGLRTDDPVPAVARTLPKVKAAPNHYRALPHGEVAGVLARVRARGARRAVRLAFELMVLTGVRSGEARLARWEEVDFEGRTWTIPAHRMKYTERGDHRVPLSARALAVLREAGTGGEGLVFRASRGGALPDDAFRELLHRLAVQANPHGFRSSFRDWCAESGHPRELAEAALAHAVGDKVEAAYARTDLYERRRGVMEAWAEYLGSG